MRLSKGKFATLLNTHYPKYSVYIVNQKTTVRVGDLLSVQGGRQVVPGVYIVSDLGVLEDGDEWYLIKPWDKSKGIQKWKSKKVFKSSMKNWKLLIENADNSEFNSTTKSKSFVHVENLDLRVEMEALSKQMTELTKLMKQIV